MARLCDRCDRGSNRGNSRSHSNIATKRQQFANLQSRRVGGVSMKLCTRCLKTMSKTLAAKVASKTKKATA
ncbi:MAG: Ribosomal family [Candidatus Parcubacteria bacterium]|jgi:ribosomal protein L28